MGNDVNIKANGATAVAGAATAPRTLREGDSGPDVEALQKKLKALGFDPGAADGKFGPETLAAVKKFQDKSTITSDGVVGSATRLALSNAQVFADKTAEIKKDAPVISAAAGNAAAAKDPNKDIMNYPASGNNPAQPPSRLDEQKAAAQDMLNTLMQNAKVAGIAAIPIFTPAALAICAQANANAVSRYENEVPQKPFGQIYAEEQAKAQQQILALPGVYAQAGLKGVQAVENGALAAAGIVAGAGVWAATQISNGVSSAYNATVNGVTQAYNAAADATTQAVTTAEDVGSKAAHGFWGFMKWSWHVDTAPVRWLGSGLKKLGGFLSGLGG